MKREPTGGLRPARPGSMRRTPRRPAPTRSEAPDAWTLAQRVKAEASNDNLGLLAAGVAFYGLLALFPALAALVLLYGLVGDPAAIAQQIQGSTALPPGARELLLGRLQSLTSTSEAALGVGLAGSLLLALWSASKATKSLIGAMNVVFGAQEQRGALKLNALALALTGLAIVTAAVGLAVIAGVPVLLGRLDLGPLVTTSATLLPWVALLIVVHTLLAMLYRYGPCRGSRSEGWVTPGSLLATGLWAAASVAFSVYVAGFGRYEETYGAMGAVVVLLFWLWIAAGVALLGAELDAALEDSKARERPTPHLRSVR